MDPLWASFYCLYISSVLRVHCFILYMPHYFLLRTRHCVWKMEIQSKALADVLFSRENCAGFWQVVRLGVLGILDQNRDDSELDFSSWEGLSIYDSTLLIGENLWRSNTSLKRIRGPFLFHVPWIPVLFQLVRSTTRIFASLQLMMEWTKTQPQMPDLPPWVSHF